MSQITYSLTVKQIIQVTLISLVTVSIFTVTQFLYFADTQRNDYIFQQERISQVITRPLERAIWDNDQKSIQDILDGLESTNILAKADVVISAQLQSLHSDFVLLNKVPDWFSKLFEFPIITSKPLYSPDNKRESGQPIAYLLLHMDSYQIYQSILQTAKRTLLTTLMLTVILAAVISWFMNRLVISPLKGLMAELNKAPQHRAEHLAIPHSHNNDELGALIQSYNQKQSALTKANQELQRVSTRDPITNLPNRLLFDKLLKTYQAETSNTPFSLIYININSIREIASALGFSVSEQLISITSNRLKIFDELPNILAHLGGGRFIISHPETTGALPTEKLCQHIIEQVTQPVEVNSLLLHLSTNIGIAHYPKDGQNSSQLIRNAHSALLTAQQQGKNAIAKFEPDSTENIRQRLLLESEIIRAINNNEFQVYLQPQIDMRNGQLIGAEALTRWHHPDNQIRSPADFIPLAEETGLIIPLGDKILEQVCQYLHDWQKKGKKLLVSINLSTMQLDHPHFADTLKKLAEKYNINPSLLKLEITESWQLGQTGIGISLLKKLHEANFSIVLDDFGIGNSNLNYFHLITVDMLKIEKSFVKHEDDALIRIISMIAKVFNIPVIAEGIETAEQKEKLLANDIYYGQGYLFSPALQKDEFEKKYFSLTT